MHMSQTHRRWTADEVQRLPDDGWRYEVIDGDLLMTPAPSYRHQYAAGELFALLLPYGKRVGLQVVVAPAAVRYAPRTEVQPDVFVLPLRRDGRRPDRFSDVGRLTLAVEVLSPSTARSDRLRKRRLYQEQSVPEYWVVDMDGRSVERWRPASVEAEVFREVLDWRPVAGHEPLAIDLIEYFRTVCDS